MKLIEASVMDPRSIFCPPPSKAVAMDASVEKLRLSEKFIQVCLDSSSFAKPKGEEDDASFEPVSSQDLFCTPDFLTPVEQQFAVDFDGNKENARSTISPSKLSPVRSKRPRPDGISFQQHLSETRFRDFVTSHDQTTLLMSIAEESTSTFMDEPLNANSEFQSQKQLSSFGYIPPNSRTSLSALRRRVLSPPCIENPFLSQDKGTVTVSETKLPSKQAHLMPALGATCLSRYREEFHEIEEVGRGSFSCVFKVLKRLDGCLYAVKRSHRQLSQDSERRLALTEVQALAAIGFHKNVVRYHTAWFENDQLHIQMELCDGTLRNWKQYRSGTSERFLLDALQQVAEALAFVHSHGLAHLDVKPDNIYIGGKGNNVFKLGDFGRASRVDGSMCIEEGDSRYMPLEMLNDDHRFISKADIFALGASIYELARDFPLMSSGAQFQALRQGKLTLLPGFSLPFQNLLKSLVYPDPKARLSAEELCRHPIFRTVGGTQDIK